MAALVEVDPCTGWQVLAKSLQHLLHVSLSPLASSPHFLATRPQSEMHLCGVCSTPATGQRGEPAVPRASPTLCWGPSTKEEKEGGRKEGGTERTSLGLIQIQIPKYCILYKSLKKKVRRDVKWSPGLTTKGESITPVTVQTYLCTAWL